MNIKQIENSILDYDDGSCRDININNLQSYEVIILINNLLKLFKLKFATNYDDHDITKMINNFSNYINDITDFHSIWINENSIINEIQLFIHKEKSNEYFIEITFFPESINKQIFNFENMILLLKKLLINISIKEYFVRYENASWKYGDISISSGVIFSNNDYPVSNLV